MLGLIGGAVLWFIWTRPSPPADFLGYPSNNLARIEPPSI
jgi:hypothetical protein